ncbi:MAG: thioredoxin [Alphaproteobacteria bacterium]|nr:thioredoxin [Alphaproteobacteria bacterium]
MIINIENIIKPGDNVSEEFEDILKKNNSILLDFFATWCGPCRMLMPLLDKVSEKLTDLLIIKIDVDKFSELANNYSVSAIPHLVLIKNGTEVASHAGFASSNNLIDWINDN